MRENTQTLSLWLWFMVLSITTVFYLLSLQSICNDSRGFTLTQSWLAVKWAACNTHLTRTSEWGISKIKALQFSPALLVLCVSPHHNKSPFHVKAIPDKTQRVANEIFLWKHPPACKLTLILWVAHLSFTTRVHWIPFQDDSHACLYSCCPVCQTAW